MFSKVGYRQVDLTMTNKWLMLLILLFLVFVLSGCKQKSSTKMAKAMRLERGSMQTIRFDDPNAINLEVNGNSVSERIDAVKQFMAFLDNQPDVDFSSGFEQSRVMVRCKTALDDWWQIDFHLVWPSPAIENQHFNLVKLLNWTASLEDAAPGDAREPTASIARSMAVSRLLDLTKKFAQETENRVRIVPPAD